MRLVSRVPWVVSQYGHYAIRIHDAGRLSVRAVVGEVGGVIGGIRDARCIAALA